MSGARLGLRGRLALSIAAIVVAAFAVTFYAVYETTGSQLRSRIDRDLRAESDAAARALGRSSASPAAAAASARHYIDVQPFGPSARLLIVTLPGVGAVTNEPELVGLRGEPGERAVDARAELRQANELRTAPIGYSNLDLEDAGEVRLLTRRVRTSAGTATIRAGEPLQSANQAQSEVAKTFLLAGAVTLALALIAAYLVARLGPPAPCGAWRESRPRSTPATSRTGSRAMARMTRSVCSPSPSTTCSTGSRTRSRASASSSRTPRTSCARR